MDLFKKAWGSLTFKRHLSTILRNAIVGLLGLIIFLVAYLIPKPMLSVWVTGAILFGIFYTMVIYELVLLLVLSLKAKRNGKILPGKIIRIHPEGFSRRFSFDVECETPKIVHVATEPIFWQVDGTVLMNRRISVLYLGEKSRCLILPN